MKQSVRLSLAACGLAAGMFAAALGAAHAAPADSPIVVKLDIAKVVKLPDKVQTLVVGNPIIVDVTVLHGGNAMVVTGKGFGSTNLIMLDRAGNVVSEATIRVEQATDPLLIVQRGMDRESYSCAPRCQPTVELGDSSAYTNGFAGAIQSRNGLATPQGVGAPGAK